MPDWTRREWLGGAGAALAAGLGAGPSAREGCTLSIGTYSLKGLPLEDAVRAVAELGYDGVEVAVLPGFDGEPGRMPAARRRDVRRRIAGAGLALTAVMEQLTPAADDAGRRAALDRLRGAFALAADLGMAAPLVQTVLGGGRWDEKKGLYRDRLAGWVEAANEAGGTVAIKPHRGGALSRPEEAVWLIRQLGDPPRLRMVYDYSHYAFRDMPLEATVREALPYTAHVAVKDAVRDGERVAFALAGEAGTVDYVTLLRLLYAGGYRGDVCCEVSSQISGKPGYDPVAAARTCYRNMARAFERARVPRAPRA
jgi:inosose dehydratase